MKTQPPQALRTGRVKERLVALGNHVQDALKLTRLDPVQTSEPKLSKKTIPALPEVTNIVPDNINYAERAKPHKLKVHGSNLQRVQRLQLIRSGSVGPWTAAAGAKMITHSTDAQNMKDGKAFDVDIALADAPAGVYNLLLTDETGQTAPFTDVFTIDSPGAASSQPAGGNYSKRIKWLSPPCGHVNQKLLLFVIGEPESFTDQTTFTFYQKDDSTPESGIIVCHKLLHSPDVAVLKVEINNKVKPGMYQLNAKTGSQLESKKFHVHPHREDWLAALTQHDSAQA